MSPASALMQTTDSQESYSSEPPPAPYDDTRGSPPDYGSPPLPQHGDDQTPLIVHQKRQVKKDGPMSVDDFGYEVSH
jgi:hypothetical protein